MLVLLGVLLLPTVEPLFEEEGYGARGDQFDVSEDACPGDHERKWCGQKLKKKDGAKKDPNCCAKRKLGSCSRGTHMEVDNDRSCHEVNEEYVSTCCRANQALPRILGVIFFSVLAVGFTAALCVGVIALMRQCNPSSYRRRIWKRGGTRRRRPDVQTVTVVIDAPPPPACDGLELPDFPSKPITATAVPLSAQNEDDYTIPMANARPLGDAAPATLVPHSSFPRRGIFESQVHPR